MKFDRSKLTQRNTCPWCGSTDRSLRFDLDGFRIVRCTGCTFQYVLDVAIDSDNSAYYEAGYSGIRHQQGQEVNARNNTLMLRSLGDMKGRRLLDIGSGFGFLPAYARDDLGMIAYGAELSHHEREFSERTQGVPTFASLDQIPDNERFDVITLFEVIEHVLEPREFIARVTQRLNPGGRLVIGTDNFDASVVTAMADGFPKWIPNQHISLFNPATLAMPADGMELIDTQSYTPWEFRARLAVIRLTGGRRGRKIFNLDDELKTEDSRGYRFFCLRKAINAIYARCTASRSLEGAMMYATFRKL